MKRYWVVPAVLAATLTVASCVPTSTAPAAPFSSVAASQSTTWAWVKLVRIVSNVGQDGLVIRESDSGRVVPGHLLCKYGATDVDCAGRRVNGIRMMPNTPFRLGEKYRVEFAPRLLDSAGRAPIVGDVLFQAGPREEDQGPTPVYSWATRQSSGALGGSYAVEDRAQARATVAFSGTSVTAISATSSTHGLVDLYVDRALRRTVDLYSPTTRFRVPLTISGLPAGPHQLDVVVRGEKGNRAARGTNVVLDGVSWPGGSVDSAGIEFAWGAGASATFSQGWAASSDTAGSSVSITYRGPVIDMGSVRGPWSGIYAAYLDGRLVGRFDDAATGFTVVPRRFTSTDAVHTLRLVPQGQHSARAVASTVSIDYFDVPAPRTAPSQRTGPALPSAPDVQDLNRTDYLPTSIADSDGAHR